MENTFNNKQGSIIYFSHGGGPMPVLGEPSHAAMVSFLRQLPEQITRPDAVIVISAHWEARVPAIIGSDSPSLIYDYYGFPKESYELQYPAPGNPELAESILSLLKNENIASTIDYERGWDHGVFIPMKIMYPDADIPVTQISLIRKLDPESHIDLGNALRSLVSKNILIFGSGFSFHNLRAFNWGNTNEPDPENDAFQEWLIDVCTGDYTQSERKKLLIDWEKAPNARYCHPREEHLLPLHTCFGIADKPAEVIFDDYIAGKRSIALRW